MTEPLEIYVCRHGETAWSLSGQHTSFTDLPLTENGKEQAIHLGKRLGRNFSHTFTSPLLRAKETAELAGFSPKIWDDLTEWNYGQYEGKTTREIQQEVPDWTIFDYGARGGESVQQMGERADRVVYKLRELNGRILLFTSGHFSRVLAARWVGLPVSGGRYLITSVATIGILAYSREEPVIQQWNCGG